MFFPRRLNYFSDIVNREVKEIYWNVVISNLASTMMMLFEPIFLYKLGYSLVEIIWFFMLVYLGYVIFITLVAHVSSRIGYKHSILISNVFYVVYWILLYQVQYHHVLFLIAPFVYALQKSFFWPPYHADIALNNAHGQRGREIGALFSLVEFASILGPILGGVLTAVFGFKMLFAVASILMLTSAYPLFLSEEIYSKHQFRFRDFWKILRKYPENFFGYWGYAEDFMLMTLWPIFVYLVLNQYLGVGAVITVANLIAIMVMLYVGMLMDQKYHPALLKISSVFYGLTWFFRQFAGTFAGVFTFDTMTRVGKAMVNVPMTALSYHLADRNRADIAIAYGVFYEFSIAIGKLLTALLATWILVRTGNIYYVFMAAGSLTMFYGLLQGRRK